MPADTFPLSDTEKLAVTSVDNAYNRNKLFWNDTHERQRRLYKMVVGGTDPAKEVGDGRANIKTGIPFMIHQIMKAILKNALFVQSGNVNFIPTKLREVIFGKEEMEEYLDFLIMDEFLPLRKNLEYGLSDLISHGTSCLRPSFLEDVRTAFDGENDLEVLVYSGPTFTNHASWDTYPTAGATSTDALHEVIFVENMYPHQLREWEKQGWIENVDALLEGYREPSHAVHSDPDEHFDPRVKKADINVDAFGRIDILIYWGLFPIYNGSKYVDDNGKDRSKDEFESLIIKPVNKDMILGMHRNPYFHQHKEVVFGKYFDLPGQLWGESIFGMMERLLVHQEDWFNIIQDAANNDVAPDIAMPDNIDSAEAKQQGPARVYNVDAQDLVEGKVPTFLKRPNSVLPDTYEQRNFVGRLVQEVSGIMDFLRGVEGNVAKTATEIEKLSQSINVRFEEAGLAVQGNYMLPAISWMVSMLSQYSDDDYVKAYTGLEINPFKQFDPMMPNMAYRVKLEGSIRAIKNIGLQNQLRSYIEIGQKLQPMPDENGELTVPNTVMMFFDMVKMSGLRDTDQYKLTVPPLPVDPGAEGAVLPAGVGDVQTV